MPHLNRTLSTLERSGNALALDFVNTVHSWREPEADAFDYLQNYDDLIQWLHDGIGLPSRMRRALAKEAKAHPRKAARVLRDARKLRGVLYRLFISVIRDEKARKDDLELYNRWLAHSLSERRLERTAEGFELTWGERPAIDLVLWPVIDSATKVLVYGRKDRLRECRDGNEGCGWLFLDTSKNGRRRWCDMHACGNLAKAHRHRARAE